MKPYLVFDMDGVLVDVTDSYRETISRTVEHFSGSPVPRPAIQDYKNQGGWNDDWSLSHHIITERGVNVTRQEVIDYFQQIFHGDGTNGLILRERWLALDGTLDRLAERFQLAVFSGRLCWEVKVTLDRFAPHLDFSPVIGMESVANLKPHPEGLTKIVGAGGRGPGAGVAAYVGDTVDDARCARAASVPFVGIAAPANPRHDELVALFRAEGAKAVLDDINGLESVL